MVFQRTLISVAKDAGNQKNNFHNIKEAGLSRRLFEKRFEVIGEIYRLFSIMKEITEHDEL